MALIIRIYTRGLAADLLIQPTSLSQALIRDILNILPLLWERKAAQELQEDPPSCSSQHTYA